jgi:hypothetical protein
VNAPLRRASRRLLAALMLSGWVILPLLPALGVGLSLMLRLTVF